MSRVPVVPGGRGRCNMTQGAVAVERGAAALALPLNLEGVVDTGASVRPSVRDVAAHAGVSVGTVSHVLNHPERVSETTRKRVEGAIASLGFVRSETARRLRDRGSSVVGVVVHDVSNPFFTEAARGIEDRLRESGCVPMLCSSDADSVREQEILSLLAGMGVRGVIIMPSATTLDRLGMIVERGIRVVLLDHPPIPEMSTVVGDDVAGARAAISHLLEIGHRRIGFVNGPLAIRQAKDRHDGVLKELTARGLDPARVLQEVESEVDSRSFNAASGAAGAGPGRGGARPPAWMVRSRRRRFSAPMTRWRSVPCGRYVVAVCRFLATWPLSVTTTSPSQPSLLRR